MPNGQVNYKIETLAKMFNCSIRKVYVIIKDLVNRGLLKVQTNFEKVKYIGNSTGRTLTMKGGFISKSGFFYSISF